MFAAGSVTVGAERLGTRGGVGDGGVELVILWVGDSVGDCGILILMSGFSLDGANEKRMANPMTSAINIKTIPSGVMRRLYPSPVSR